MTHPSKHPTIKAVVQKVNYEPALEIIADEYDRDIDASHEDPRLNS
jgi:hypothetical protein